MSAAWRVPGYLNIRLPGLNIYASQCAAETARICRGERVFCRLLRRWRAVGRTGRSGRIPGDVRCGVVHTWAGDPSCRAAAAGVAYPGGPGLLPCRRAGRLPAARDAGTMGGGSQRGLRRIRCGPARGAGPLERSCTIFWYVSGEFYLGTLVIRHRLSPELAEAGGHVGYHLVAPWRRQGHATRMLAAGAGGFFDRLFAPRVMQGIYADALERLNAYAREHAATRR
jgi:hypothetical protein